MFGDVPLVVVETGDVLRDVAEELSKASVLGFDLEADSFYHYHERICLVQVSNLERDFVIDPLALDGLDPLKPILENPDQVKVFHGADYDIVSFKRDYGYQVRGLFDTMVAAQFAQLPRVGLADLLESFFGVELDKRFQKYDWARRPLEPEHLAYARADTHWLIALYEVLGHKLSRTPWGPAVREECSLLEEREWTDRRRDPWSYLNVKGASRLPERQRYVLWHLHEFRDGVASRQNRPVFKVIPNRTLLACARTRPRTMDELAKVVRPRTAIYKRYGPDILKCVEAGLQDDRPLPRKPRRRRPPPRVRGAVQPISEGLRAWRSELERSESLDPTLIITNKVVGAIARAAPETREQLAEIPDVRRWQVEHYGDAMLEIVQKALEGRT